MSNEIDDPSNQVEIADRPSTEDEAALTYSAERLTSSPVWDWVGKEVTEEADISLKHVQQVYMLNAPEFKPQCPDILALQEQQSLNQKRLNDVQAELNDLNEILSKMEGSQQSTAENQSTPKEAPDSVNSTPKEKPVKSLGKTKEQLEKMIKSLSAELDRNKKKLLAQRQKCMRKCVFEKDKQSGNMNCLNLMGQEEWTNRDKAFSKYLEARGLQRDDPSKDMRVNDFPVGLENLGATCYMNAFLQTWFHDARFVEGVFKFPVGSDRSAPIYQLQLLFASLKYSLMKCYNPRGLVESMNIREFEQQDANEFFRLFTSMLEHAIEHYGQHNFISKLFGGKYAHTSQCKMCLKKSTRPEIFTQIELNLKDRITLEECLKDYLHEEILDGSNQYFCANCNSKQDAGRYTELLELPQTLNFQLMRFVIDMTSEQFTKKKLKSIIRFPLSIDMKPYVSRDHLKDEESHYDLRAVMLHKGQSAHSGHYIAHVFNEKTNSWFMFNDRIVRPIDESNKKMMFEVHSNDDEEFTEGPAPSTSENLAASMKDQNVLYSSRNAYMLIYSRREAKRDVKSPEPPTEIMEAISETNSIAQASIDTYKRIHEEAKAEFTALWNERNKLINLWKYEESFQNTVFVPSVWLKKWMLRPLMKSEKDEKGNEDCKQIDIGSLLCKHGGLSLHLLNMVKRLSIESWEYMCSLGINFKPHSLTTERALCRQCVVENFNFKLFVTKHSHEVFTVQSLLQRYDGRQSGKNSKKKPTIAATLLSAAITNDSDEDLIDIETVVVKPDIWISKEWLRAWMRKVPQYIGEDDSQMSTYILPNDGAYRKDVACPHGGLTSDTSRRRLVPYTVWSALLKFIPDLQKSVDEARVPVFDRLEKVCSRCVKAKSKERSAEKHNQEEARRHKVILKSLLNERRVSENILSRLLEQINTSKVKSAADGYCLVSWSFMESWKKWISDPDSFDMPEFLDNYELICEHNRVRYDINVGVGKGSLSNTKALWTWELLSCSDKDVNFGDTGEQFYFRSPVPVFSVQRSAQSNWYPFCYITNEEWDKLCKLMNGSCGPKIPVDACHIKLLDHLSGTVFDYDMLLPKPIDESFKNADLSPELRLQLSIPCWDCIRKDQMNWAECVVYVRTAEGSVDESVKKLTSTTESFLPRKVTIESMLTSDMTMGNEIERSRRIVANKSIVIDDESDEESDDADLPPSKKIKYAKENKLSQLAITSFLHNLGIESDSSSSIIGNGKRTSKRNISKSYMSFNVTRDTSIKDLKVAIMQRSDVSPIYQRIFLCGQELTANDATMESLNVLPNYVFDLVLLEAPTYSNEPGVKSDVEVGFLGTSLLGGFPAM